MIFIRTPTSSPSTPNSPRPVRYFTYKDEKAVKPEEFENFIAKNDQEESHLEIRVTQEKGRGVYAKVPIKKGEVVVEYHGELISAVQARRREKDYEKDLDNELQLHRGGYMYFFTHKCKGWCIDATPESDKKGRLINHSRKHPNLKTLIHVHEGVPRLFFYATCDIEQGTELLYDYGEKRPDVLRSHPWLRN